MKSDIETLKFLIQGSRPEPYIIHFKNDSKVMFTCDCPAGQMDQHCKHRLNLLLGEVKGVVEGIENIKLLEALIVGTHIERALRDFYQADNQMKKEISEAKKKRQVYVKALDRALLGEIL